jgi:hypothetical protein
MKQFAVIVFLFLFSYCDSNKNKETTTVSFIYVAACDSIFYSKKGNSILADIKGSKKDDSAFIYNIIKENTSTKKVVLIKPFGGTCGGIAETATNLAKLFATKKVTTAIVMPDSTEEILFNDISLEKAVQEVLGEGGIKLSIPKDEETDTLKIKASAAMTLLPTGNNRLFYYQGEYKNAMTETDYAGIRKAITAFRQKANSKELMFLIKSDTAASFKNIVDLLDEMVICKVPKGHYAEVDITENEKKYLKSVISK